MTDELRRLHDAATPGPWRVILPGDLDWQARRKYRCVQFGKDPDDSDTTSPIQPQDAALIVALANAAPALLDVADAARGVIRSAQADDDFDGQFIEYLVPFEQIDALRAALARLDEGKGKG